MDNKDEFVYFFHKTFVNDKSKIDDIFHDGLLNWRGTNMSSTLYEKRIKEGCLAEELKGYCDLEENAAVFLIQIPKYYLTPKSENGQLKQVPLPIWKDLSKIDNYGRELCQLSPEFVYGVYLRHNDAFLTNPGYSPVNNPVGLKFDDSQIEFLLRYGIMDWYNFAVARKDKSFEDLTSYDKCNHIFDNYIIQYKEHFNLENNQEIVK